MAIAVSPAIAVGTYDTVVVVQIAIDPATSTVTIRCSLRSGGVGGAELGQFLCQGTVAQIEGMAGPGFRIKCEQWAIQNGPNGSPIPGATAT